MLFEIAILEVKPAKKRDDEEVKPKERLILGPVAVLAPDSQNAAIRAVMDNPDKLKDVDRDHMQVLVRPFA